MLTRKHMLGLACLGGLLAGCAEKLTFERWQTIQERDSREAVTATLGEPFHQTEQTWVYYDPDRQVTASIYFDENGVTGKEWSDPKHGMQGRSPNVNQPGDSEQLRIEKRD